MPFEVAALSMRVSWLRRISISEGHPLLGGLEGTGFQIDPLTAYRVSAWVSQFLAHPYVSFASPLLTALKYQGQLQHESRLESAAALLATSCPTTLVCPAVLYCLFDLRASSQTR